MKSYYLIIQKNTSRRTLILLFLLFIIFMFVLFPVTTKNIRKGKITEANRMLDTRLTYNSKTVKTYLASLNSSERLKEAIIHLTLDLVYPVIYTLLLSVTALTILKLINNLGTEVKLNIEIKIVSFPLLITLLDYTENALITVMLLKYPTFNASLAETCGIITTIKWSLVILTITSIILLSIVYLARLILHINKESP